MSKLAEKSKPIVNPQLQGQKSNIKPMGLLNLFGKNIELFISFADKN